MPIGPSGTETINPITIPLIRTTKSIIPKKRLPVNESFQVPGQKSRFLCKTACSDEGTVYACRYESTKLQTNNNLYQKLYQLLLQFFRLMVPLLHDPGLRKQPKKIKAKPR